MAVMSRPARASALEVLFPGDRRVWGWSALVGVPLIAVILIWCLVPRSFYTGTDSVNALTLSSPISGRATACQRGLDIPAGTRRLQLQISSAGAEQPALTLTLRTPASRYESRVARAAVAPETPGRVSFPIPDVTGAAASVPASICVRGRGEAFAVGAVPTTLGITPPLRVTGRDTLSRMAVWYLPRVGARRSYLGELSTMLERAARLAPGFVSPVLLGIVILGLLPGIALLAVRCLALAAGGRLRRMGLWLYLLAALNAVAWSLITPVFQGPDELDHFAYTQSVVQTGHRPSPYPASPQGRWSTSELDALLGSGVLTDHETFDTRAPGLAADMRAYRVLVRGHPSESNGGGNSAMAGYGPLYYLAVAPGYLLAPSGSVFTQLGLMRLISALIGALATLFTYLAVRELLPSQPWAAVLAGLLVGFEPMFGFISGVVNNDVGINAGSAAVAWLLLRLIRRGLDRRVLIATGVLLGILPYVKDSAYDLFVLAAFALLVVLWRARAWRPGRRGEPAVSLAMFAVAVIVPLGLASLLDGALAPSAPPGAVAAVTTAGSALKGPLHAPISYLSYLWEVFLPRLPGMAPHFATPGLPAQTIFIRRGWAAFGWYDTVFPGWVYEVLEWVTLSFLALGIAALVRRRRALRRLIPETAFLVLFPVVVIASFEAVFYTAEERTAIAEMGRYVFPAMAPLAALAVGGLFALSRRRLVPLASAVLVLVLGLSYASQLLTFTAFFS